jgi:Zn-dependent M28 family amino/carboxypeptidase
VRRLSRLACLVLALILALALPAIAADPDSAEAVTDRALATIRPEAIQAHIRFLADDLLEGRGTATRGHQLAANYVAARFAALGLAPGGTGGTYFQTVPLQEISLVTPRSSFALVRNGERTELRYGEDYLLSAGILTQPDLEVTAPLVFAGFGVHAPELGHDDYAGLDVRDKLVVVIPGAPSTFPNEQRAYYSVGQFKTDEALARGALGVIGIATPKELQRFPWTALVRARKAPDQQWLTEAGVPFRARPKARGSALLNPDVHERLFAGAPHSWDEVLKAAEAGKPLSFPLALQASLHTVSEGKRVESANVAALLPGSDPKLRDEVIVLSAHLDHLGIGEPIDGDAIYNGAYDNASGIAALLEMANAFASLPKPPRRSILFLAVTGEERGLQGSEYFTHNPTVPRETIVANLNIDMFWMMHPLHSVVAYGAEHSSLGKIAEAAARQLGIAIVPDPFPDQVIFIRSDQFAFIRQGIPAVYLNPGFDEGTPAGAMPAEVQWLQTRYHKPNDDLSQTFDFAAGAKFVQLNFLVAYRMAQEDQAPTWKPGDFFAPKPAQDVGKK